MAALIFVLLATAGAPAAPTCGGPAHVAPTPVRRLTRAEYNATVRDLLATKRRPADAFPPDEPAAGFESNTLAPLTRPMLERYLEAADALAAEADLSALLPCEGRRDDACAGRFLAAFLRRAFRRPATGAELARYGAAFRAKRATAGFEAAVRHVIAAALVAPSFLYRGEDATAAPAGTSPALLPGHALASRISYFLLASMPDDRLLMLAEEGGLARPDVVEAEARRLIADPRSAEARHSFFWQWLGLVRRPDKSRRAYPLWADGAWESMRHETAHFVDFVFLQGDRSLRTLLLAPYTFVDAKLARIYDLPPPPADGFWRVSFAPGQRAGLLTQAAFLAANAFPDQPSPIHRGKFVRENLLCQPVAAPPPGLDIQPPKVDASKPTRDRFEDHRLEGVCSRCHRLMDPIGFAFQHYDGIGRWQSRDGAFPVDARGEVAGSADLDGEYDGAPALAAGLVDSPDVQRCFTRQWLRFALARAETPEEACVVEGIRRRFVASGLDVGELLVAIATSDLFRLRPSAPPMVAVGGTR